ncbi:hypothetical protein P0W64_15105 [Tsukamurella sp. 8F]|uniref:hypothetical protein n=1 Tax=unclassified Tsukamurella TaxID=2633480 RepID=UPI0023B9C243|nr:MULTISPECIES: hypothetical protein [unclassified Tsukamurella]MDF0532536.1 hypothetical protein [Tsukamurella sp. 8J]MDF0588106.1 hypothetical protein [Tsukamurella sp. 8F]
MNGHTAGGDLPPELDLSGFSGWVSFADLSIAEVPRGAGVYVVVRPGDSPPRFLDVSPAGHYKGRNPTRPVEVLAARWVDGARIVYIGKSKTIRSRLYQYRNHGAGSHSAAHSGGKGIWQLADSADLLVAWRETPVAVARPTEKAMIAAFCDHYGCLPFGNEKH